MAIYLRDGYRGTCTSPASGTGPYTGIAAVANYISFATLNDGDLILVGVRSATGWQETGIYTKSGGATPTLTRTTITSNINRNTSPIDWTPGTPLVIYSTVSGPDIASLLGANTWQQDQSFNGKRLRLSPDGQTFVDLTNTLMEFVLANAVHTLLGKGGGGENSLLVQWADNGSAVGPTLVLDRVGTSSVNKVLGTVQFNFRNSSAAAKTIGTLGMRVRDPAAGSEDGAYDVQLMRAGSMIPAFELNDHNAVFFATFQEPSTGIMVGKNSGIFADVGVEVRSDGGIASTTQDQSCLYLNRRNSYGTMVSLYRDGTFKGSLDLNSSGKPVLTGAVLAHFTDMQGTAADPAPGTVMCALDEMRDGNHPFARISTESGDPTVWGVSGGRDERGNLQVEAVGLSKIRVLGPCRNGDLLMSSNRAGVACRQPDDILRSKTVAKALASVPRGQEALIPCTLMAG